MSKGATRFSFRAPGFDSLGWQGWKYMDMVSWEEIPLEVPLLQVKGSAALYLLSRDWLGDEEISPGDAGGAYGSAGRDSIDWPGSPN